MLNQLSIGSLKVKWPIIQGGMGIGISKAGLASTVANQGGVGVISAAGLGMFQKSEDRGASMMDALKKEIGKARSMTKGILGVNIMVAMTNFADLVKTAINEKIDVIFAGAGLPLDLPKYRDKASNTKLVPIVSSARAAKIIVKKWWDKYKTVPDAFVLEGPKAGGHIGFKSKQIDDPAYKLESLIPQVLEGIKPLEATTGMSIPIIAAGGIYTGEDIAKAFELGASGVQMGTRFVTTHECDADLAFKQSYIDSEIEDMAIITSPVGLPGRAINNSFLKSVRNGEKHPVNCPFDCIKTCGKKDAPYCISLALKNAQKGKLKSGFAFAGANAYRAKEIISVEALFTELINQYDAHVSNHKS
ncbi:MAG: NAD(P)H-dependent flavin oxidoreductase [Bacillota bacterium]